MSILQKPISDQLLKLKITSQTSTDSALKMRLAIQDETQDLQKGMVSVKSKSWLWTYILNRGT